MNLFEELQKAADEEPGVAARPRKTLEYVGDTEALVRLTRLVNTLSKERDDLKTTLARKADECHEADRVAKRLQDAANDWERMTLVACGQRDKAEQAGRDLRIKLTNTEELLKHTLKEHALLLEANKRLLEKNDRLCRVNDAVANDSKMLAEKNDRQAKTIDGMNAENNKLWLEVRGASKLSQNTVDVRTTQGDYDRLKAAFDRNEEKYAKELDEKDIENASLLKTINGLERDSVSLWHEAREAKRSLELLKNGATYYVPPKSPAV